MVDLNNPGKYIIYNFTCDTAAGLVGSKDVFAGTCHINRFSTCEKFFDKRTSRLIESYPGRIINDYRNYACDSKTQRNNNLI